MSIFVSKTVASFLRKKKEEFVASGFGTGRRNRRRHPSDRRQSVRVGVIVTLSSKNDRRSGSDRRSI